MGPLGITEVIFIFVLALLVFGPKKLPELGRTFGKGMAEFKRASNELKSTFQREMDHIEHETKDAQKETSKISKELNDSYYDGDDDYYDEYGDDGVPNSAKSSSADPAKAESSSSPGGSSDSAATTSAEAPSADSSSPQVAASSNGGTAQGDNAERFDYSDLDSKKPETTEPEKPPEPQTA